MGNSENVFSLKILTEKTLKLRILHFALGDGN